MKGMAATNRTKYSANFQIFAPLTGRIVAQFSRDQKPLALATADWGRQPAANFRLSCGEMSTTYGECRRNCANRAQ